MNKTIQYYNEHAESFILNTEHADMDSLQRRFMSRLPKKACILDAGCGSGRDSLVFLHEGYQVDAFDASEEICRFASKKLGFQVQCLRFEEIEGSKQYDGIWACASLLHVKQKDLPDVLQRLYRLLKPEGILYASFKEGNGEHERNGRFFTDLTEEECRKLMEAAGFQVLESVITNDVRPGREEERWVNVICKKK